MSPFENIHATGVCVDGIGVIIRGSPGTGKSLLVLEMLSRNPKAILVADDRIDVRTDQNHLFMTAPKPIAGLIELRGRGIMKRPFKAEAQVHLVIDLVDELERFLEPEALQTEIKGIRFARVPIPKRGVIDSTHQYLLLEEAVAQTKADLNATLKKPLDT